MRSISRSARARTSSRRPDEREDALRWLDRFGNPYWLVLTDYEGRSAIDWGIYGAPETSLVDGQGTIAWKFVGPVTDAVIADQLLPALERIEQGQVLCQPIEIDVVHLCIELIDELRALTKSGQTINYDHDGEERAVMLDRQMLSNVITNLVTNAVKYSPENKPISLRTSIIAGRLHITTTDEGMGIPEEDQQHLFVRFFRGSNATTIQGTGLGLNLVKRYLELYSIFKNKWSESWR